MTYTLKVCPWMTTIAPKLGLRSLLISTLLLIPNVYPDYFLTISKFHDGGFQMGQTLAKFKSKKHAHKGN
jgi:hypothetical protein